MQPTSRSTVHLRSRLLRVGVGGALVFGGLTACAADGATTGASTSVAAGSTTGAGASSRLFDTASVHDIEVAFDQGDYDAMVAEYQSSGDKTWISATVTIDGVRLEQVGLRLKGNSSLRGLSATEIKDPASLPWLVRLDKYVDGQAYDSTSSFVVRSSTTKTALNEAVALDLIGLSGLATEKAVSSRFTVNGSAGTLRLVIENLDDAWDAAAFTSDGILYKAEAGGDYSYRGDGPESYVDVFDQETDTGTENLTPLIGFLAWLDGADDASFAAELADHLDVKAFATYLAMQEIVDNFDDISGPGNNSYLRYDSSSEMFTVVAWDQNLSFGTMNGPGGAPGGGAPGDGGGTPPAGAPGAKDGTDAPADRPFPGGAGGAAPGGGGPTMGGNVLAERFMADDTFAALYTSTLAELTKTLVTSGTADKVLAARAATLTEQASDLVPAATIASESTAIASYFD